jgi:hypothetical protein
MGSFREDPWQRRRVPPRPGQLASFRKFPCSRRASDVAAASGQLACPENWLRFAKSLQTLNPPLIGTPAFFQTNPIPKSDIGRTPLSYPPAAAYHPTSPLGEM